ncbi:MAG: PcrA [Candidatus Giovannonibacteria bacterium GW2011_GWC2_44_9]|uniref:DNA 3'-5' helicase n=2 Tax=Candidatus Giovannoniibacteriota TaxID=1752738 RepID=A0A0G1IWZ8_9BACT|nr:MAG: PcrA [Candidatus Giovannonibacteria bacterium GW2011_GWA1_44_29]KKT84017.1 MAG: PcrA [Candidatus Giovannonibacteria bacterium GW2011_GWC2_44_9]KKT91281.1 MAG: PcrA [Parcubacteria group bacterium GW2011_GWC1_45_13]KKU29804.1 MAG: PcrA [Candidatus Giovannonibacteria bacterium GW2011_GWB1_46_20]
MAKLGDLNSKQKEAVETTDGPVLVIAGAGAGKTKVITERIKYLIEKGVASQSILAVTFTNKAAEEMKSRIARVGPFIGTFHALGLLIIRENLKKLGVAKNFTILDEDDSLKLIKECLVESRIDPKQFDPSRIKNNISRLKNQMMTADEFIENPPDGEAGNVFRKMLGKVWRLYEEKTKAQNLLDFDDLLLRPVLLFKKDKEALKIYQGRWRYIHIDEYQDTNEAQYVLSQMLAESSRNILAVGDIDQAIYSWRGADFKNVLNFQKDYPDAKIVFLEENYRSTDIILEAANAVITHNKFRIPKNLWTKRVGEHQIRILFAEDEKKEAEMVAGEIKFLKTNIKLSEIAVLYRTNAQSRALEEVFLAKNIPYKITGGTRFYERREIKDLLAYLKLIQNPNDELSYKRIANVPPRKKQKIDFDKLMEELRKESKNPNAHEFLKRLIKKIGYHQYINDGTEKGLERWQNIEELIGLAKKLDANLENFLEHVSLFSIDDRYDRAEDRVSLMTMHTAKGLEFDAVFVVGLEEGLFPHTLSFEPEDLEEERRLYYVAITRAKTRLYLTTAGCRTLFGERAINMPSRFLKEIPSHLLVYLNKQESEENIYVE